MDSARLERHLAEAQHACVARMDVGHDVVREKRILTVRHRAHHEIARVIVLPEELVRKLACHHSLARFSTADAIALRPLSTQVATVPSGTSSRSAIS